MKPAVPFSPSQASPAKGSEFAPLSLTQIQELAWQRQEPPPATTHEALARLQEALHICLRAFEQEQSLQAQASLEDTLLQTLVAMKTLQIQPDAALNRALARLSQATERRVFHLFPDRVEIRAGNELRGGWPLFDPSDVEAVLRLARELDCDVVQESACQLGLFGYE